MTSRREFVGSMFLSGVMVMMPHVPNYASTKTAASITILPQIKEKYINRNILGVGLWKPPFNNSSNIAYKLYSGTSCRLWLLDGDKEWGDQLALLKNLNPTKILLFDAEIFSARLFYNSSLDNNLPANRSVSEVLKLISRVCEILKLNNINPSGGLFWEAWNEPAYRNGGRWAAEDLARYVNELAQGVSASALPVKVLAPLNQDFHRKAADWNEKYCAQLDPTRVSGLVTHYYSHFWHMAPMPKDDFLKRAGYGGILDARLRRDLDYVLRFGAGNWGLHCSEWNIHPPQITSSDFDVSRDMAAAFFAFDAIKLFIDHQLESAQFFRLLNQEITRHFAALSSMPDGSTFIHPTGALFGLFHEHLEGMTFKLDIDSPIYIRSSDYLNLPDLHIAYVTAIGSISDTGHISLFLANKHADEILVNLNGGRFPVEVSGIILRGSNDRFSRAVLHKVSLDITSRVLVMPARSIIVLKWQVDVA